MKLNKFISERLDVNNKMEVIDINIAALSNI